MDQGFVSTSARHYARLALIFFATVLGLVLLGFAFGSSSASADDGGSGDGGLVPVVGEFAGDVVETAADAPAVARVPLADVPLVLEPATSAVPTAAVSTAVEVVADEVPVVGEVLDATPAGETLGTLTKAVDSTVGAAVGVIADVLGPVLRELPGLLPAALGDPIEAATTSATTAVAAARIAGSAHGLWFDAVDPFGTGNAGASVTSAGAAALLPAAALGLGFFMLLFSRRFGVVPSTMPGSPVYETDTSPD